MRIQTSRKLYSTQLQSSRALKEVQQLMREKTLAEVVLFVLLAAVCMFGCSDASTNVTAEQIVLGVVGSQENLPDLERRSYGDQDFLEWAARTYGVALQSITDAYVAYAPGALADEIAVFKSDSNSEAAELAGQLEQYQTQRAATFAGYAPAEESKVTQGIVEYEGPYTFLLVVPASDKARQTAIDIVKGKEVDPVIVDLTSATEATDYLTPTVLPAADQTTIESSPDETKQDDIVSVGTHSEEPWTSREPPRPEDSSFDQEAVLTAWKEHSSERLSGQELEVYNATSQVLANVIDESMSDYEKELALHDYLMDHVQYDDRVFDHDYSEVDRNSATPYGALVEGRAICYGFSSTYELLMNMVGIDCLRVDGTAESTNQLHSWNVVCLDGDWYCVDIAWDRNAKDRHKYFNRTSDEYASWNRKWDREAIPEATGGPYSYKP